MERLSAVILVVLALCLVGCSGGEAQVSAEDEAKFKKPGKPDLSKIPANTKPAGPAFIGEPSGATNGGGGAPPSAGS